MIIFVNLERRFEHLNPCISVFSVYGTVNLTGGHAVIQHWTRALPRQGYPVSALWFLIEALSTSPSLLCSCPRPPHDLEERRDPSHVSPVHIVPVPPQRQDVGRPLDEARVPLGEHRVVLSRRARVVQARLPPVGHEGLAVPDPGVDAELLLLVHEADVPHLPHGALRSLPQEFLVPRRGDDAVDRRLEAGDLAHLAEPLPEEEPVSRLGREAPGPHELVLEHPRCLRHCVLHEPLTLGISSPKLRPHAGEAGDGLVMREVSVGSEEPAGEKAGDLQVILQEDRQLLAVLTRLPGIDPVPHDPNLPRPLMQLLLAVRPVKLVHHLLHLRVKLALRVSILVDVEVGWQPVVEGVA
eukprot:759070-Hanusia_phi.AAC.3